MPQKYESIAADLRQKIHTGVLAPGEQLPSQEDLAERYRVSVGPVRQAIDVLRVEGLIDTRQGTGTYVRPARQRVARKTDRYQWEKDRVRLPLAERSQTGATEHDTGLSIDDLDFHAEYHTSTANEDLAAVFRIAPGTKLLHRIYRTRIRIEGIALTLIDSYLVYEVAAENPLLLSADCEPWPGGTQSQLYTIGIEVDHIIDEVTARPPQPDEAEALGIGPGVSVLVLRKTSVDTDGRVVEVSDVVMPGDRTVMSYCTQLERWQ